MKNFIAKKLMNLGTKLSDNHNDLKWIIPEADEGERAVIGKASAYTSNDAVAQWGFIQSIKHVHDRGIPGDIVECGVWKGGNIIISALMRAKLGFKRDIWGYDTFAGMSAPSDHDVKPGFNVNAKEKFNARARSGHVDWCYVPIEDVKAAIETTCGQTDVNLIKGDVMQTLRDEKNLPSQISILRLDTDFYESTKIELEILYPRVSPGGVVIVDDYGVWQGSKKAVDEYFGPRLPWLHYVNRGVRLFIKP
jgi:O-methyltransferase